MLNQGEKGNKDSKFGWKDLTEHGRGAGGRGLLHEGGACDQRGRGAGSDGGHFRRYQFLTL